jgi:hypothetical protein
MPRPAPRCCRTARACSEKNEADLMGLRCQRAATLLPFRSPPDDAFWRAADARTLPGACPPLGFWDPLGLCFTTAAEVKRMREAEARCASAHSDCWSCAALTARRMRLAS